MLRSDDSGDTSGASGAKQTRAKRLARRTVDRAEIGSGELTDGSTSSRLTLRILVASPLNGKYARWLGQRRAHTAGRWMECGERWRQRRGSQVGGTRANSGCDGSQAAATGTEGVRFRPKLEEAEGPEAGGEGQVGGRGYSGTGVRTIG